MISVVDLASYRVVASTRTSALDLYDAHGVTLDNDGYVRVGSLSSGTPKYDAFVRLKLPSGSGLGLGVCPRISLRSAEYS